MNVPFVSGRDARSFMPAAASLHNFNFPCLDVIQASDYRRLHTDLRTSRFKFSQRMERAVKMPLKPGHGLMDWIRLCQQNPNMAGTSSGKPIRVTEKEMTEHSERDNAWTIINGKVYNIAPYMDYHPGGVEQLMRVAGTDGTKLFNEKHPWVNYESMLKSCFVGSFVGALSKLRTPTKEILDMNKMTIGAGPSTAASGNLLNLPGQVQYPRSLIDIGINCTWKTDEDGVQLLLDTPWKHLSVEQTVVECMNGRKLRVLFRAVSPPSELIWNLPFEIEPSSLRGGTSLVTTGRLSISFQKQDAAIVWPEFLHDCAVKSFQGRKYRTCRIRTIDIVTHDTRLFVVDLPNGDAISFPVGSHVFIRLQDEERPYTPILSLISPSNGAPSTTMYFLIKIYETGRFTPRIEPLKAGDTIAISDPEGSFNVNKILAYGHIYLLAAGTGFTPMVRIIQHCLYKARKNVTLIFFNKTQADILWRQELDTLSEQCDRFCVIHVLSNPDDQWTGRKGRVSSELLCEFLQSGQDSNFVCICGPDGFVNSCLQHLQEIKYDDSSVHVFQG